MATFNFTVRATDDRGAYADRDFSITVRNTVVNRFMAAGNDNILYMSPDATTWTGIPGLLTGEVIHDNFAAYGNGIWVVMTTQRNTPFYHTSYDGIEWVRRSLPMTRNSSSITMNHPFSVTFGNGKFYVIGWDGTFMASNENTFSSTVQSPVWGGRFNIYSSPDGINWTLEQLVGIGSGSSAVAYQATHLGLVTTNTASAIAPLYGSNIYTARGIMLGGAGFAGIGWGDTSQMGAVQPIAMNFASLTYQNGMFLATPYNINSFPIYSFDGKSWNTLNTSSNVMGYGQPAYGNGNLIMPLQPHPNAVSLYSTGTRPVRTSNLTSFANVAAPEVAGSPSTLSGIRFRRQAVFHNGIFLLAASNLSGTAVTNGTHIARSIDGGNTWTQTNPAGSAIIEYRIFTI